MLSKYKIDIRYVVLPVLVILCGFVLLRNYFFPSLQIVLAVMVAPFIFRLRKGITSNRYLYISLLLLCLYMISSMKVFLFLSVGSLLFFTIEGYVGLIGFLPFVFLLSISPALHYAVNIFTFDLRIGLSHISSEFLNYIGFKVQCYGNYFILPDGFKFNVDKACLGLNMFNTGLALSVLMIGLAEKKSERTLNITALFFVMLTSGLFLVLANLMRIITIVWFRSLPNTFSHEVIGILSLLLYMALPMALLINKTVSRFGKSLYSSESFFLSFNKRKAVVTICACALLCFSFMKIEKDSKNVVKDLKVEKLTLPGYTKSKKEDGVYEFRRDSILIYVKPAVKPFESDHPPALCWKASGFDVEDVTETNIGGNTILVAQLKKESITQYTAWWYDNGSIKTTDQWVWRLNKGEPFRIINITAQNKQAMLKECERFLKLKLF